MNDIKLIISKQLYRTKETEKINGKIINRRTKYLIRKEKRNVLNKI